MNKDLFLAILALDSYNRGYGQNVIGLGGLETFIGKARLVDDRDDAEARRAGFYALAYEVPEGYVDGLTGTVISYRGTNFNFNWNPRMPSTVGRSAWGWQAGAPVPMAGICR